MKLLLTHAHDFGLLDAELQSPLCRKAVGQLNGCLHLFLSLNDERNIIGMREDPRDILYVSALALFESTIHFANKLNVRLHERWL